MRYLSSGHCLVCLSGLRLSCLSNTSHVGPLPGAAIMHNVMSVYVCMYCHQQDLEQRQLSVLNWGANANLAAHVAPYQHYFACCAGKLLHKAVKSETAGQLACWKGSKLAVHAGSGMYMSRALCMHMVWRYQLIVADQASLHLQQKCVCCTACAPLLC